MTTKPKSQDTGLTASAVAAYLEQHPGFFESRDHLLMKMELPHAHSTNSSGAISLVERQVSLLRERNVETRRQLDELVEAAKNNDAIFVKCRKLVLSLLDAKDSTSFFNALEQGFKRDFKSDAYSLIMFSEFANQINHFTSSIPAESASQFIGDLMELKQPFLGVLRPEAQDFLFRHASNNVKSAAVLALSGKQQFALLAIGSADPNYFQPGMGTLFIGFIADVLARLLPQYVYVDPH